MFSAAGWYQMVVNLLPEQCYITWNHMVGEVLVQFLFDLCDLVEERAWHIFDTLVALANLPFKTSLSLGEEATVFTVVYFQRLYFKFFFYAGRDGVINLPY